MIYFDMQSGPRRISVFHCPPFGDTISVTVLACTKDWSQIINNSIIQQSQLKMYVKEPKTLYVNIMQHK